SCSLACAGLQRAFDAPLRQFPGDGWGQGDAFFVFACFPGNKQTDRHGVSFTYCLSCSSQKTPASIHQMPLDFRSCFETFLDSLSRIYPERTRRRGEISVFLRISSELRRKHDVVSEAENDQPERQGQRSEQRREGNNRADD